MAMVEEMTGFEFIGGVGCIEETGVEQAIGGVEHPDGQGHGCRRGESKVDVGGARDEVDPEGGYSRCVQREQMPEGDGTCGVLGEGELCGGGHC